MRFPTDVAFDGDGNLYIADSGNHVVRSVDTGGIIDTFAGTATVLTGGQPGYSGDGGLARQAKLSSPFGVAVDAGGNVFIADTGNSRIRLVDTNNIITTVGGFGSAGYAGDGGPATQALMDVPSGIMVSGTDLYVADMNNHRVRRLEDIAIGPPPPPTPTPTATGTPTNTPTVTPTPTITPTATPVCPDADADTLNDCAEATYGTNPNVADSDADGCADGEEVGPDEVIGGRRDPVNVWDFFDVPSGPTLAKDKVVSVSDITSLITRFGSAGSTSIDPLSPPAPPPAYHTAYDRTPASAGGDPWDTLQPDGVVSIQDISLLIVQFGHTCASPP
jgi:hypothetical protein